MISNVRWGLDLDVQSSHGRIVTFFLFSLSWSSCLFCIPLPFPVEENVVWFLPEKDCHVTGMISESFWVEMEFKSASASHLEHASQWLPGYYNLSHIRYLLQQASLSFLFFFLPSFLTCATLHSGPVLTFVVSSFGAITVVWLESLFGWLVSLQP